jgi:nucleoside-diphosphate-sugar epimerase
MNRYFSGKTVVVTGAAGFVGSHLVDSLLESGAKVVGVDNFITGRKQNIAHLLDNQNSGSAHFTFIEANVSQSADQYLPSDITPDVVFHFASPASPPQYQAAPIETYLVNSMGTHHLLQMLQNRNPQARLVFASTSEVYGDPLEHPQTESYWGNVNPNGVRSCYDEAKRLGETICGVFYRDFGIDARMVRIFNTYGPRINPADGRVVPQFVGQALQGQPLPIYGDGSQTRSFCYVSDLVDGILLLAASDTAQGETVNIGNPVEQTVAEIAEQVRQAVAMKLGTDLVSIEYHPLPSDDPTRRKPNIDKAKSLLGWEPHVSFAQGLEKTIEYFQEVELNIGS